MEWNGMKKGIEEGIRKNVFGSIKMRNHKTNNYVCTFSHFFLEYSIVLKIPSLVQQKKIRLKSEFMHRSNTNECKLKFSNLKSIWIFFWSYTICWMPRKCRKPQINLWTLKLYQFYQKKPFVWEQRVNPKRHFDSNQVDRFQLSHMNREKNENTKKKWNMCVSVAFLKPKNRNGMKFLFIRSVGANLMWNPEKFDQTKNYPLYEWCIPNWFRNCACA